MRRLSLPFPTRIDLKGNNAKRCACDWGDEVYSEGERVERAEGGLTKGEGEKGEREGGDMLKDHNIGE